MKNDILYSNTNYKVIPVITPMTLNGIEYPARYEVVNKETKITEFISPSLPECCHIAVQADLAMERRVFEWAYGEADDEPSEGLVEAPVQPH